MLPSGVIFPSSGVRRQLDQYPVSDGAVFLNNNTCLTIYSEKEDPNQEKTAREISRFSRKDAETWLKWWKLWQCDEFMRVTLDPLLNPPDWQIHLSSSSANRGISQVAGGRHQSRLAGTGGQPQASHEGVLRKPRGTVLLPEICGFGLYQCERCATRHDCIGMAMTTPTIGYARGGTHQIAHACHQILVQNGVKFFTHAEVARPSSRTAYALALGSPMVA